MIRRALLAALLALAFSLPWSASQPSQAALRTFAFELETVRTVGPPVFLQFIVAARSPTDAERAVVAALSVLPVAAREPAASAAWRPWGWAWSDDELPVPVAYNPTGAPPTAGPQALVAGLQAWSTVEGSRFAYRYAGITDRTASILEAGPDGENVVSWLPLPCDRGCVLGLTSKEEAHEVDMLLNSNPTALMELGLDVVLDWRTVILHELGHMAGLEHSCPAPWGPCTPEEIAAVMYFQYRGVNRTLAPDDRAGLVARYPAPAPLPVGAHRVAIEAGWNLSVLPPLPTTTVAAALACLESAYTFDGERWSRWSRQLPAALVTLVAFKATEPAWLFAAAPCQAEFPSP